MSDAGNPFKAEQLSQVYKLDFKDLRRNPDQYCNFCIKYIHIVTGIQYTWDCYRSQWF